MKPLLACLIALSTLAAAPQPTVGALMERAAAARTKGDLPGYLAALKLVVARMPEHPALQYNLARGFALNGDAAGAVAQIRRAADMGFGYDAASDPAMASVKTDPGFAAAAERLARGTQPSGAVPTTRAIGLAGREPEGVVSTADGTLYVGTIKQGQILRVDAAGLTPVYSTGGAWGVVGLRHDPANNSLVACIADDAAGLSRVVRLRLSSMAVVEDVAIPEKGVFCNDAAILERGRIAVTDSTGGRVWIVAGGKAQPMVHAFEGPNGVAAVGKILYVADAGGLHAIDLATDRKRSLRPEGGASLFGIDGMVWHRGALHAVQALGTTTRLLRLTPAGDGVRMEVLSASYPALRGATTAAIAGSRLVVLSQTGLAGSPDAPVLATIPLG